MKCRAWVDWLPVGGTLPSDSRSVCHPASEVLVSRSQCDCQPNRARQIGPLPLENQTREADQADYADFTVQFSIIPGTVNLGISRLSQQGRTCAAHSPVAAASAAAVPVSLFQLLGTGRLLTLGVEGCSFAPDTVHPFSDPCSHSTLLYRR